MNILFFNQMKEECVEHHNLFVKKNQVVWLEIVYKEIADHLPLIFITPEQVFHS